MKYTLKRVENKIIKWYNLSHNMIANNILE